MTKTLELDVAVVGAGFAGVYAVHRFRSLGMSVRAFEAGSGVGGTWFWNRYPGARCDIESMEYSYQFSEELQQEWEWTERYSPQAEILAYIEHVVDRFDLRDDIQLDTRVTRATFDDSTGRWIVETDAGDRVSARFCVMATGCLSAANAPDFEGLDDFGGTWVHTGNWPHEGLDVRGKRVGVIGTGSSGIQSIPILAEEALHLTVFQRTPNYSVPAGNRLLDAETQQGIKSRYRAFREENAKLPFGSTINSGVAVDALSLSAEEREQVYEQKWKEGGLYFLGAFGDLLFDEAANETASEFVRGKIRSIVQDPKTAALLTPDSVIGCKRLCADTGYFETFNRDDVTLVDVNATPIERITEGGILTSDGEIPLDVIVFATGFDAMTGALSRIDIRGAGGRRLVDKWAAGPRTYLGLGTAGFPNLFTVTGPGSPSVLSNMVPSIEQHVNWIAECIAYMRDQQLARIEATPEAEDAWVEHVNEVADSTLYPSCNSWYLGANIPGKPRVFMPYLGFDTYVEKCNDVASKGYEGFALTAAASA
jgi:cyclohexanone monooxygenase